MKLLFLVILTEVFFVLGSCLGRLYLMDDGDFWDLFFKRKQYSHWPSFNVLKLS